MKTAKLIILAVLFACVTATLAQAGSKVLMNQLTTLNASVKNNTSRSTLAAVKLTGYDDAGSVVGQLCKYSWLGAGQSTKVEFPWQAPNYATGIYWSSKVEVSGHCPGTDDKDDD